jgi:hypothetical protein
MIRLYNMDRDLDKMVDAEIDEAIAAKHERYNYDEEMSNYQEPCCDECQGQAVYFIRKGNV